MKEKIYRVLALLLSLLMMVNSLPLTVFAEEVHDHSDEIIELLPEHTHSLLAVEAADATCTQSGNTAYWYCDCGVYFSDAEGTVEIEKDSWVTTAPHATVLDETVGYWVCTGCGQYFEDEAATKVIDITRPAGVGACGHELTKTAAKAATCQAYGISYDYWTCKTCEKYYSDEAGTVEVAKNNWRIAKEAHNLKSVAAETASCVVPGTAARWICTQCGISYDAASGGSELNPIPHASHAYSGYYWDFLMTPVASSAVGTNSLIFGCSENGEIKSMDDLWYETSTTKGMFANKRTVLKLETPIVLDEDQDWTVEVAALGRTDTPIGAVMSTAEDTSGVFVYINEKGDLSLVKNHTLNGTTALTYWKVSDADFNASVLAHEYFTYTQAHTYQLRKANGIYSFWLDGVKVGNLALYEQSPKRDSANNRAQSEDDLFDLGSLIMTQLGTGDGTTAYEYGIYSMVFGLGFYTGHNFVACGCANAGCTEPNANATGSHTLTKTDAKSGTCVEPGNIAYWTCEVCKGYFADADATIPLKKDSWVKASHDMIKIEAVDASCTSSAKSAYWLCKTCGNCFADEQGATKYEYVAPTTNAYSGYTWDFTKAKIEDLNGTQVIKSTDGENYLKFGASKNSKALILENQVWHADQMVAPFGQSMTVSQDEDWTIELTLKHDTAATNPMVAFAVDPVYTNGPGLYIRLDGNVAFQVNKNVYLKVADSDFTANVPAGFDREAYHNYQVRCVDSKLYFWLDGKCIGEMNHWYYSHKLNSEVITPSAANQRAMESMNFTQIGNGTANTTTAKKTNYGLSAYVKYMGVYTGHTYGGVCDTTCNNEGCTETRTVSVAHDWDDGVTQGNKIVFTCNTCRETREETVSSDCTHTSLTHVEKDEATCTEDGNVEYWRCDACYKVFSDATASTEIEDVVVPNKGHAYSVTDSTAASCNSTGVKTETCSNCGDVKTTYIPGTTGHFWDFENGTMVSNKDNTMTFLSSNSASDTPSVADGVLVSPRSAYTLSQPVTLNRANDWSIEIVAKNESGTAIRSVFSGSDNGVPNYSSNKVLYVYINNNGDMMIGRGGQTTMSGDTVKGYLFYRVSAADFAKIGADFDIKKTHRFELKCESGVINYYLDGSLIGPLAITKAGTARDAVFEYQGCYFDSLLDTITVTHVGATNKDSKAVYGLQGEVDRMAIYPGHSFDNTCDTTCNNDGCTYTREIKHTLQHVAAAPATCQGTGNLEHWKCKVCGLRFADAEGTQATTEEAVTLGQLEHAYTVSYAWADNYNACQATFTCTNGTHASEVLGCSMTHAFTPATCVDNEYYTHTAQVTFQDQSYTDIKKVETENTATGHTYGPVTFTWEEEGTDVYATATVTCDKCAEGTLNKTLTKREKIDGVYKLGDCQTKETTTYIAKITLDKEYTSEPRVITGDLGTHNMKAVPAKPASCKEAGNNAYWYCSVCETYYKESAGITTTDVEAETLPKLNHNITEAPKYTWTKNTEEETYEVVATFRCQGNETEAHTFDKVCDVEKSSTDADCVTAGTVIYTASVEVEGTKYTSEPKVETGGALGHQYGAAECSWSEDGTTLTVTVTCPVCEEGTENKVRTETVAAELVEDNKGDCRNKGYKVYEASGSIGGVQYSESKRVEGDFGSHSMTKTPANDATCAAAGNNEYWYCSICETYYKDAAGTQVTTPEAEILEKLPHTYGEADFVWNQYEADKLISVTVSCSACPAGTEGHTLSGNVDEAVITVDSAIDGDCKTKSSTTYLAVITINGKEYRDIRTVEGELGDHHLKKFEKIPATCVASGHEAYWYCDICDTNFADEACTEVLDQIVVIPVAKDHVWDFSTESMTSNNGNTLSNYAETAAVVDGELVSNKTVLELSQPIVLDASNYWSVKINAKAHGDNIRTILSTGPLYNSSTFIYINKAGDLMIGYKGDYIADNGTDVSGYVYYKVSNADYEANVPADFDADDYHTYELRCENGKFYYWLDGVKIGKLAMTEGATGRSDTSKPEYTQGEGTPFDFSRMIMKYMGNGSTSNAVLYGLNATVKSFEVANGHSFTNVCDADCNVDGCTYTRAIAHVWDEGAVTKEPSEYDAGERTFTCFACGATTTQPIPALGHTHTITEVKAKDPNCEEAGNTAYWYCAGCGIYFGDAEG